MAQSQALLRTLRPFSSKLFFLHCGDCNLKIVHVRVRTSDKYRMVYSDYQRLELEKEFCTSTFVTSERKAELSSLLNLTERQIKIWFQNR
ncbi:unnamed protein product [Strongylus vulgaris]|uniref:Homeobox domain-containing protein n=1 Tax=Strongylus vulgaris TaxID=40348 RepID=A0A3P7J999_STRVU|nr:unnamed protein product [Strongylus vulgaris]